MRKGTFLFAAVQATVIRRAMIMSAIVGNVIGALNHGDKILMGLMVPTDWLKVGLTFLIPYCRVALNCEMGNPTKSTILLCP